MSFAAHSSYIYSGASWLGMLPSHWSCKPMKAVTSCNDEVLGEATPPDYEIEYVEISDVEAGSGVKGSTPYLFGAAPSRARRRVQVGDVIVSTVRTYLRAIATVRDPPENFIASTGFAVIRPRGIDTGYLSYAMQTESMINEIIARSVGVSYPAINASELISIKLPVPPRPEQEAIAAFLDRETGKIDALVEEQRRLIELLKEKRQAVISHAVTKGLDPTAAMKDSGVEWLGDVPAHWDLMAMRRVITKIEQGWSPECESRPAEGDEWAVLKAGCVNRGVYADQENKALSTGLSPVPALEVKVGDVLMSRANGSPELVGSAAFVSSTRSRVMLSDKIFRLVPQLNMLPRWFAYLLASAAIRSQIRQAISGAEGLANNLPQSSFRTFLLALPPIDEQSQVVRQIANQLSKIDALMAEVDISVAFLRERRAALISAAVTGKIDVRGVISIDSEAA